MQTKISHNVYTEMESKSVSSTGKNSTLPPKEEKFQPNTHMASLLIPNNLRKNSSSNSFSEHILKIQKKLAKLGFYDGPLDGVEGPKTRRAITLWKKQHANEMQHSILPKTTTDDTIILIQHSKTKNDTMKTNNPLHSEEDVLEPLVADIIQVQKALRAFGNPEVTVTGIEDRNTIYALKQFQKMFNLPITGKINRTVLIKMREIGLLN
ncbi:peptidoglycan-binding domain-containing protein [Bartonella sp. B10]